MEFFEQYKHPKWQQKRLEALQAAEFACQACYDSESELHIHHKFYRKGRKVWEYEICELEVLCDSCHKRAHEIKDAITDVLASVSSEGLEELFNVLIGYTESCCGPAHTSRSFPHTNPHGWLLGVLAGSSNLLRCSEIEETIKSLPLPPHMRGSNAD